MQLANSTQSYGWISILFHWVVAVLVIAMFALGLWMVSLDYYSTWYHTAPDIHKSIGVLIMAGMLIRLFWNLFNSKPKPLGQSKRLNSVANIVHFVLYVLVFALGVSGYLISTAESHPIYVFNWFDVPALIEPIKDQADKAGEIHEWLAFILIGLVSIHAIAALKHHFWDKDNTLKRMLKP
ncbi:cytochrome b [Thiomicrorhabdus sp.]|uniref:cytochrome b n=1 Tax=Thiomicrorhabdus sp. TaxID=2039724 RepID=UPI002AA76771|nr:cytochrome b [Thiomicrorhabdus sp.]